MKGGQLAAPALKTYAFPQEPGSRPGPQQQQEGFKLGDQKYFPVRRAAKTILGQVTKERNEMVT